MIRMRKMMVVCIIRVKKKQERITLSSQIFLIDESEDEEIQRCDTTLLVTGQTERRHPVETLNNFEMFDHLGANEARLGLDDELAENRIFASKSAINWVIYDWSVRKKRSMLGTRKL
jgi:hypothetical protein